MASERDLWRTAAGEGSLSAGELDVIAGACEREDELEEELTFLLAALSANLAGPFLRAFVDRIGPGEAGAARLSVIPALREALASARRPGEGGPLHV